MEKLLYLVLKELKKMARFYENITDCSVTYPESVTIRVDISKDDEIGERISKKLMEYYTDKFP